MKIAVLEDNVERQAVMRSCLADRFYMYESNFFDDPAEMMDFLDEHLGDMIVIALDHDLELKAGDEGRLVDPGSGREVAEYLAQHSPVCPVVIHSTNSDAALGMQKILRDAGWQTHRVIPFEDMEWITSDWFRAIRRAIVGAARARKPLTQQTPEERT
jgi:CheY-like chemotaxis protein